MTALRDWLQTLWPASYMGSPFYFDRDGSQGGRGVVVHEFPHRDDPFNEDLGQNPRYYDGEAYVHGDDADAQANAFEEILASLGPGILVVPTRGPVNVRLLTFKRTNDKDKLGYIAFSVKFVREGAATALISVPLAGRLVGVAADAAAAAIAANFSSAVVTVGQPDFVVEAAVDGVQMAAATIDAARQAWAVDPAVSAQLRDGVTALMAAAPVLLADAAPATSDVSAFASTVSSFVSSPSTDAPTLLAQAVTGMVRALGAAIPPDSAAPAMLDFAAVFADAVTSPPLSPLAAVAAGNVVTADQLARLSALTAWAEALALASYPDRPAGVTARADCVVRFDAELEAAYGAAGAGLFVAIENLRASVVDYLTRLINDLAPVIEIEASASMPSLWWAWRLYADPSRSSELVARNAVRHPSFMPQTFSALAPAQ
jgi:prophage DNA circulation protein